MGPPEVTNMDEEKKLPESPEEKGYVPRPWWQVAGAWVGLLLFIGAAALVYLVTLKLV